MTFTEWLQVGTLLVMVCTLVFAIWSHISNRREIAKAKRTEDIVQLQTEVHDLKGAVTNAQERINSMPTAAQVVGLQGDIKRLDEKIGGLIQWIDRVDGYLRKSDG